MKDRAVPVAAMKARWMADPSVRAAYEALAGEFEMIEALLRARHRAGLTQIEVARRMGTSQSAIARMESGRRRPSLRSLALYAKATGSRLTFAIVPLRPRSSD